MEKIGDVVWSWLSSESNIQKGVLTVRHNPTLAELLDHLERVAPGVPWGDMKVSGAVVWEREATGEERARRDQRRAEQAVRHEQWERDTYARLKVKFDSDQVGQDRG